MTFSVWWLSLFLLSAGTDGLSLPRRRRMLLDLLTGGVILTTPTEPALAARGAAELDFEYYMRDLLGGNDKEGTVQPSTLPTLPSPRTLRDPLLPHLLNDDCSSKCLSTLALIQQIQRTSRRIEKDIERDIQDSVQRYRESSRRSFYARAPWKVDHVSDQYYFEWTAYALWRTAADMLPNFRDRDAFVRSLGQLIYRAALEDGLLRVKPPFGQGGTATLVGCIPAMSEILDLFRSCQFCKSYCIGEDQCKDQKSSRDSFPVFDEIDDEALASGTDVNLLVTISEPSTLLSSLQITGEGSRFIPDYIGSTLAAMFSYSSGDRGQGFGLASNFEIFFVDIEYRPNPKDYFPTEQLIQFTLHRT